MNAERDIEPLSVRSWLAAPIEARTATLVDAYHQAAATSTTHGTYIAVGQPPATPLTGELGGMPFAVKDNIDVAGMPTTAGSPLLQGRVPSVDAGVVSVLREAGGVVIGKTNMHELAFGVTSNNAAFGPVRNPYDAERVAGGSSGGSAATVALGTVPVSLGTDTGGSITIPASFCGVVGFRPTTGRYPGDGLVNLSWTRDTVGLHGRSVDDVRRIDEVITRTEAQSARPLRERVIGVPRSRYVDLAPEVAAVANHMLEKLGRAAVRLVDVEVEDDYTIGSGPGLELVLFEAARLLTARAAAVSGRGDSFTFADLVPFIASPDVRGLAEAMAAHPMDSAAYAVARQARWRLRRSYADMFHRTGVDAIIAPTCPVLPPHVGTDDTLELNGRAVPLFATMTRNTAPGTVGGTPMLALPAGRTDTGLCVGMCLEARFGEDDGLLALGEQIESSLVGG